ncbi:polyprotein of EF-Ts, chloroplastic-like isoform X2 [Aristolochia californica]|uniref:polyprotein of EF-Ts, chloroplastic-like isoform X2 n=1 Tax=Aristolochia californica TaxID=171875 RepID=UPI0035D87A34
MTPVIPCSIGNIYLFPKAAIFTSRKDNYLTRCNFIPKFTNLQGFLLPQSSAIRLFPKFTNRKNKILAALESDVAVEESSSAEGEGGDVLSSDASTSTIETKEAPPAQSKRPRTVKKSDMPPVKNDEVVPGASFTGKVRSIQPFGAFVDFGAFTDGLVHVSRMSDSFVKDVNSVVSIGQEVTVRIVEANMETGRISLTMRGSDDITKLQQRKDGPPSGTADKPTRRNATKSNQKREGTLKTTKFVKGQVLDGTVKNLTRAGAFISLPEGEEGFLPTSEESEGFGNVMGSSSLQAGDEVKVRVLRINRGNVTLTMKKEENVDELNMILNQGVVHTATNPFFLAFRENKDIAVFLEEREKLQNLKSSEKVDGEIDEKEAKPQMVEDIKTPETVEEIDGSQSSANMLTNESTVTDDAKAESDEIDPPSETSDLALLLENAVTDEEPKAAVVPNEIDTPGDTSEQASSSDNAVTDQAAIADEPKEESDEPTSLSDTSNQVPSLENALVDETPSPDEVEEVSNEIESANQPADQISSSGATEEPQATPLVVKEAPSAALQENLNAESTEPEQNGSVSSSGQLETELKQSTKALVKQLREETGAGMMDCKKALTETGGDIIKAQEFLRKKGLASAEKKASRATAEGRIGSYIHDNRIGVLIEVNCETDFISRGDIFRDLVEDLAMQVAACPQVRYLATEDVPEEIINKEKEIEMQKEDLLTKPEQIRSKIVEGRIRKRLEEFALLEQPYIKNDKVVVKDWVKQTIATIGENIKVRRFVRYNLGEGLEKKSQDFAAEVAAQTAAKSSSPVPKDQSATKTKETPEKPTVSVSAALVKQLREETGAGMMDCKKALAETGCDLEKAQEYLRMKGLASADKKSIRLAAEGRISSYIHDSRIGVLIEVNCETDFVGRNEKFKELVDDLAMQVVACPHVEYVSVEDIPKTMVTKEKELEMQREDLQSKPENIREKIVEGRVSKRLGELALLEQPFIKNDSLLVKDLVKQTVAALGENIKVRRFVRFTLGESIEEPTTTAIV